MSDVRAPMHPVSQMFPDRWSPRSFSREPMTEAMVMSLFEAARWAPSASNHQPWRMVWALRGDPAFGTIAESLVPSNRVWASAAAALLVFASRDLATTRDGAQAINRWAAFDTGAAWMSLALQAHAMGLHAHAMGGFDQSSLAAGIALPEGHTLHAVVAVGTRGPLETLPEALQARETPSQRRVVSESAFRGRFQAV